MNRRHVLCGWIVIGLLLGAIGPLAAQEMDEGKRKVAALLDEGVARFQARDYAAALERFQEAHHLSGDSRILFNLASTMRALGRETDAAQTYDQYLFATARNPDGAKKTAALAALRDLTRRVGRLEIETNPRESERSLDGKPILLEPGRTLYVSPGPHELTVAAQGFQPKTLSFVVLSGEQKQLILALDQVREEPVRSSPQPLPSPVVRHRLWTWIAAGTGAALLAGAIVLGVHAHSVSDDAKAIACSSLACPEFSDYQSKTNRAQTEATAANVLFAGAGAALVGAAVLYFYEGRPREPTPLIAAGPQGWTLAVQGRF